ncbi:histidine kinase [Kribbella flavida DSM 17836]|uniref:histidine kinase n=2 Tax=Kribbella flavida TaxID=182640 RepID=D2PLZ2_KRIFD|nr:histidine kinase [Kribbella flavida DSM 17836]
MVLIAAAATATVLIVGGVLLAAALRVVLVDDAMDTARLRAQDLGELAAALKLPPDPAVRDSDLVQVVGDGGRVLSASRNIAGTAPLDLAPQSPGTTVVHRVDRIPAADSGAYRVVAHGTSTPNGPATVYVGVSIEEIDETVVLAGQVGLAAIPVFVVLLSVAMWTVLGRTLAPVERIRREADAITAQHLDRRVFEPEQRDELGRLARTVNAMLARLQASTERQRRFVADTAHELRSPIASLRTQLETARDSRRPVDWEQVSADLLAETVRMQALAEQLLLLARADAGTLGWTKVAVDLDDVVDTVSGHPVTQTAVQLDIRAVEPVQVTGDPVLLEQAVRNLVDNAVAHATRQVRVGLTVTGSEAVLTVDDDGPGIPPQHRQEIFERFTRLDGARDRDHGGAGLGLAIVADITQAHGGRVEVEDSPLGGARFRLRLPATEELRKS